MTDLLHHHTHQSEAEAMRILLQVLEQGGYQPATIKRRARGLLAKRQQDTSLVGNLLVSLDMGSVEGRQFMVLCEALLRIPDEETAQLFIREITEHHFFEHLALQSDDWLVGFGSRTGRMVEQLLAHIPSLHKAVDPVALRVFKLFMQQFGRHFILGETIEKGIEKARNLQQNGFLFSFDMLGEGARSFAQAEYYYQRYQEAIMALQHADDLQAPSLSIKLSALYPHMDLRHKEEALVYLVPRLLELAHAAQKAGLALTLDAEELERLEVSVALLDAVCGHPSCPKDMRLGMAVQAYHKAAYPLIKQLYLMAKRHKRAIPVRLVKGAYWDYEIRRAQRDGLEHYPVFTRKPHSDVSYLACAHLLHRYSKYLTPQYATHNALTIAALMPLMDEYSEFQLLKGMGEGLYTQLASRYPCRIYAPIGPYPVLLPYLIRRILEQTASDSFLKLIHQQDGKALQDPVAYTKKESNGERASHIAEPRAIYPYKSAEGVDQASGEALDGLQKTIRHYLHHHFDALPIIAGAPYRGKLDAALLKNTMHQAHQAFTAWNALSAKERCSIMERFVTLAEQAKNRLLALLVYEGSKTILDALGEYREMIALCRYYILQAQQLKEQRLHGMTGEENRYGHMGRGVFLCISPWNFPLAISTGQIVAALLAGNSVIAKPSHQTPAVLYHVAQLLIRAGLPEHVLSFLPCSAKEIERHILSHPALAGIAFTGSCATASRIYGQLAKRKHAMPKMIAETGGVNAMIVDSTALPEQVVDDVLLSAFNQAGQRCSALRVLYIQEEIFAPLTQLLHDALATLRVGRPDEVAHDIGPIIDRKAYQQLVFHVKQMKRRKHKVIAGTVPEGLKGYFMAPHIIHLKRLDAMPEEIFGPILHVVSYKREELDQVIDIINQSGYGLTLGIHSRLESRAQSIATSIRVGNSYINRSMIGAIPAAQPFGGAGLSGTGPKAGGPEYVKGFMREYVIADDKAAIGGDVGLLV